MEDNKEKILLFEAHKFVDFEMYVDAINVFKSFTEEYKESKYIDDVYYDIAICYFKIKDFNKTINYLNFILENYPNSDIDSFNKREFGKIAAKCHLGIINCYLILNNTNKIQFHLNLLTKFDDSSYVLDDSNNKLTFYNIAKENIKLKESYKNDLL